MNRSGPYPARGLSVIMPVYNEVKTVESVIRKVLEQPKVAELIDDAVQRRHLANPPRRSQPPEHL